MRNTDRSRGKFWGVVIIMAGLLFLFQNVGYISNVWHFVWPSLLILWGVSIILRPHRSYWCCCYTYRETTTAK